MRKTRFRPALLLACEHRWRVLGGRFWVVAVAGLVSCQSQDPYAGAGIASRVEAEPFRLLDQYDRSWCGDEILSGPAILILTSRTTAAEGTQWDNDVIQTRQRRLPVHRVLDLHPLPRLVASFVKARIREGTHPPGTPILLDWAGRVARRFRAATERATVLVLDARGETVFRAEGRPDRETTTAFELAIAAPEVEEALPPSCLLGQREEKNAPGSRVHGKR